MHAPLSEDMRTFLQFLADAKTIVPESVMAGKLGWTHEKVREVGDEAARLGYVNLAGFSRN